MGFTLRRWAIFIVLIFVTITIQHAQAGDDNFLLARIGVAKAASAPVRQADNTYNLTYTITLKNYGDETITSVNVEHILATEYPGATTKLIGNVVATGSLIADNAFNSTALNITLLKAGSKLYAGEKQTIVYTINVNLNSAGFGPFIGIVTASGFGNLAIPVADISVAGLDPDPNGDGIPLESGNTSVLFSPTPVIGVAKAASAPQAQANGTSNVTYTVTLKNLGNEKLTNVQVTDILTNTFTGVATFSIAAAPISNGSLVVNAAFNGNSNTNLLAAGSTLAVGAQQVITFTVNIDPHGVFLPFLNSVTARADGSASPTIDVSVNGNNPDPNGDGVPLEFSPTPVSLSPVPIIGIAKKASAPVLQTADNSYNITYTITVKNYGNVQLTDVEVHDLLKDVFPSYVVVGAVVTSGTLSAQVGFDGKTGSDNLLAAGSTLNVGATQTITFTVNVKPQGILGPYINTATASAKSGIITVNDISVDGNDPDPNGDGLPLELAPTLSLLIPVPVIGVSKSASPPVAQPNGSYNTTFKITVENLGNENLENVQVTDALASVFTAPSVYSVVGNVVASGTLAAKVGFNGGVTTDLLAPGSKLGVGQKQTITFTVNADPKGNFIPYLNTAVATATGATSTLPTTDISVDGDDPDPNDDGLPLETFPTTVLFEGIPIIGVSKSASTPAAQTDGSYNVTFTIKVENLGNEKLLDVQVTDALASVFIGPSVYTMVGNVVTSGTLAANAGFNGNLVKNLLANGSILNVGETQTITFTVNVKPNLLFGPFLNQVVATAHGALLPTTDISVDGNDPDPNGDGLPLEFSPTIVSLVPIPLIGISKSASSPIPQPDGSYLVTFNITLKNMGNELLQNVQVTDALVSIFGPDIYTMVGNVVANGTLVANVGFNGNAVTTLLAPGSTLAVGATQSLSFTIKLKPNLLFGPFLNQAIATATGSLLPVTDISVDGNNPDPNGDGLPLEFSPTSVLLIPVPVIGLAKSASAPLLQPDGSYLITYSFTVKNMGNVKLDNVQITDVMASIFTSQNSTFALAGPAVASGTLIANPTFDGDLSTNLLNSGSTLNVGETQTTQVTIRAKPALGFLGPFINTAIATATGLLLPTADLSMDGTNPDPNGDGLPLETLPTIVGLTPNPVIGIAKDVTSTVLQADGSYNVTYDIHLKNYGNVDLEDVFVTDNLSSIFNLAAGVSLNANVSVSNGLAANVGFNGFLDINLLDGAQSKLPVGGSATISYTVNVKPGGIFGPYCNTAIATARAAGGLALTLDISQRGSDPDPNGNGKPNELGENDCTPITLTPNPIIGIAKAASSPVLQSNNSYNVTYTLVVKNMGNSALTNVSVIDDLALAFPGVTTSLVGAVSTTGTLTAGPTFDGILIKELLDPSSTLAIGASGTIVFTLNLVTGPTNFGPFYNTAVASGSSGARRTSDYSTTGSDPDPNHNGDPGDPGESTPTAFTLDPNPIIGVAKAASTAILQPDNVTYNVTFTFTVTNLGNVDLENVKLTDDLASAFPSPTTYSIIGSVSSPGTLVANSNFNGSTDKDILAPGSTLARGATEHVTLNLSIKPSGGTFNFFNSSTGTAKAVGSAQTTSDVSTSGNNPDPNNNGNPGDAGENTTTTVALTPHPVIGLAKTTGSATLANGTYSIPFTITVTNLGNVGLKDVQVTDDLASVIGSPSTYSIVGAVNVTGSLVANSSFNGNSDTNLLAAGSLLGVGATSTITFTVNITANGYFGPFANSATGNATGVAAGIATSDISTNGSNPDPNGNGNPSDPGENTATSFSLTPNSALGVALNASVPQIQADGSYRVVFTVLVKNLGNVAFTEMSVNQSLKAAITAPATYTLISPPTSSGSFAVNSSYDGDTNTQLIGPNQTLAVGATETITIIAAIKPVNNAFGPFLVSTNASGKSANGTYSDLSAPGNNPDPNNNGYPGDNGENDPTPVSLTPHPVIGIAQSATSSLQPDGKYKVSFLITVRNMGNADLTNVQVTNNLTTVFNTPMIFAMSGSVTATGALTANPAYNGNSNINLLSGGTLSIGSVQLITFTVIVDDNGTGNLGPFFSNAYGSGTAGTVTYNDISTAGTNADPNGNGSPSDPNEDLPTIINLTPSIVAGVAKAVSFIQIQPDGAFRVTYTLTVKNLGNTPINNVKVSDHLAASFPAPATFSVVPGSPFTTGQLIANTTYNGVDKVDLLAAGSKLPVDAENTITLTVDVKLNGGGGLFYNSAILTALSDDATLTFADISAPGNDPDPNHNGDPGDPGENSPTAITLTPKAVVGIAKALGATRRQGDGSYLIPYRMVIKNMGNVALNDLAIEDDLTATFPSPAAFTVTSVSSDTGLKVNTAFGAGNKSLLLAGNNLQVGQTATIDFVVSLAKGSGEGPFYNSAKATANGAGGTGFTTDVSTSGNNPDPNGNGNPGDPGEDEATSLHLVLQPIVGVAKAVAPPRLNSSDNSYDVTYTLTVENLGDMPLANIGLYDNIAFAFPSPATFTVKGSPQATGSLVVNSTYDGDLQFNLLDPTSTLDIGGKETVTFTVNVLAPPSDQIYYNSAIVSATDGDNTMTYTDISTAGIDPDPNGNSNPNDVNENVPTSVVLKLIPVIGLANDATDGLLQPDGTYNVTITITIDNLGNDDLEDIVIVNSLRNTFPEPMIIKIVQAPVATGNLVVDPAYDGMTHTQLIANGSLTYGESRDVKFTINITPKDHFGVFWNSAWGTAIGNATANSTSDTSNEGLRADPTRSGKPDQFALNAATRIVIVPNEVLGVSTSVVSVVPANSCNYIVTMNVALQNYGNATLNDIAVVDNLVGITFTGASFTVQSLTADDFTVNPNFNGLADKILLGPNNALQPGDATIITLVLDVSPNKHYGPYQNVVTATATGPQNFIFDESVNGPTPDPDGDKVPDESAVTPIDIAPVNMAIPEGFSPNGDGTNDKFVIVLECGITADVTIYNRWGDKVFYQKSYTNEFDGTSNDGSFMGKPLPEGTYFYKIELSSGDKMASFITLKR